MYIQSSLVKPDTAGIVIKRSGITREVSMANYERLIQNSSVIARPRSEKIVVGGAGYGGGFW